IDLQTRNTIQTFSGHSNDANGVAFSPDAAKIITGAATYFDYSVRLWDVATGNIVYILDQTSSGSDKWLNSVVAFSPDGNRAVSVGGIETSFSVRTSHVYIWDVASGTLVNTMNSQPIGLNFSPDGSLLAVTTKLGVELRMFGPSTIPIAPFLLKPGIGSITSDNEFVWSPSGGGTYHLQISSVPDFSSPIFENTNLPTSRANVTGLVAGQYVWRVQAQNNAGSSEWSRVGLFTYTLSPTVTTGSASSVTSTSATLNATVNPNGASTTAVFEYGTSTNYGTTVAAMQSPLTGSAAQAASVILSGLTSGTTYHFRAKGTNSVGTNYGNDQSFTTSSVIYVNKDGICGGNSPCYTSIQAAMDAASTGTAIKIAQGTYDESFVLNESKSLTLQGGWDSSFTSQTSNTTFIKAPKASQGSLTLQMVTIKP
ncbi:MAG: hypothetical protein H8E10_18875, partial [Desulfobacterales bacterium]|nr:hypothetical protein [Desulfobacterales bacterium]